MSGLAPDRRLARQASAVAAATAHGLAALVVSHLPNIRWLTGFTGSAGLLLLAQDRTILVTDFRYATQAPREVHGAGEVVVEPRNIWDRLRRELAAVDPAATGIEAHALTLRDAERLNGAVKGRIVPVADLIEALRQIKDAGEIAAIHAAADLALEALGEVVPTVVAGERELDVAVRLEAALRRRGSEWHPFPTIIASGPRAALPHARTSERVIARGEFLLIDFGAQVDGYCSDITRTFAIGLPDERQRTIYALVQDAQVRARQGIRAGMLGREADALARDVIAARGYGEAFGHSLGHGLGLEVHEAPRLAATAEAPLPEGAVVTIEPGVYLPGWGGVRLEDDVWLSADGPVLLSDGQTDLITLDA
ncbi:MAG TPA: aminopeptidase P family protein [Gemmatimonadales bacterium]|nr:aminopeptidase P family protein [Gemmatimonadales bacterium]